MTNIKILVSYKDKHKIIKNTIITPIQTGRAIAEEIFSEMIGDDTGDNISELNPYYAELTAQYWAWKNYDKLGNPDYIGFMHYRRHFVFNEDYIDPNADPKMTQGYSAYSFDRIDDEYYDKIGLKEENICNIVTNADIICVKQADVSFLGCNTSKEEFVKSCYGVQEKDYDKLISTVMYLFPEYYEEIKQLNSGPYRYFYNMFICKKEIFEEYSTFLFTVLNKFFERSEVNLYSEKAQRICGYMGEFLLSLFLFKKHKNKYIRIKELYSTFVKNTSINYEINPSGQDSIGIAFGCSYKYAPYLGVAIQSLLCNIKDNRLYDIFVLESSFDDITRKKLLSLITKKNVKLHFINPETYLIKEPLYIHNKNLSRECYYRLMAPFILQNFPKIITLDVDIIINDDLQELYKVNIKNNPIATAIDTFWGGIVNKLPTQKQYAQDILQLEDLYKYYNTGVMVCNTKFFKNFDVIQDMINLANTNKLSLQEQDALNIYFKNNIKEIDVKWNFEVENRFIKKTYHDFTPKKYLDEHAKQYFQAKIFHYCSSIKPWFYPDEDFADIWWSHARRTPFYEEILQRLIDFRFSQLKPQANIAEIQKLRKEFVQVHFPNLNNRFASNEYNTKLLFVLAHPMHFNLKKFWYGIKKAFAFGKRYQKYNQKYQSVIKLLKDAKKLKKSFVKI